VLVRHGYDVLLFDRCGEGEAVPVLYKNCTNLNRRRGFHKRSTG
jgi:hypothetical protein